MATTPENNFSEAVKTAAEKSLLKIITSGDWIAPDYGNRFKIPPEWVAKTWNLIDQDRLRAKIVERIEAELADRIVSYMAAEISCDIKQILSVKERREAIRDLAREHMDSIMKAGGSKAE